MKTMLLDGRGQTTFCLPLSEILTEPFPLKKKFVISKKWSWKSRK